MNQPVVDYYRCPSSAADLQLLGTVSDDPGYFCFGSETICYGNSSSGSRSKRPVGPFYDALTDVVAEQGTVRLPVDPNEIVDNLRHERYQNGNGHSTWLGDNGMARRLYYSLRPVLTVPIRKRLQQAYLSDWTTLDFPHWPVDRTVDRFVERLLVLCMKAREMTQVPFVWFWPDGATSCIIMTHDVEHLAGRNFCLQLMDLDDSVAIKSSFQIVPEGRYTVPESFLEDIRQRGFEVNVHDLNHDGRLFSSRDEFFRLAERINDYGAKYRALGFRSGGLYRNQAWFEALNFSYDMSVPNVAHLDPQRGGCCSVMPFFIGKILELPVTTIQDYSLFHILNERSIDLWRRQTASIIEGHGLASFIVHPDYIITKRERATYRALLEHLALLREQCNAWVALPRDVNKWWRERSHMKVVPNGGGWRIEGIGHEHARLAFATLVRDELILNVDART